MMLSLFDFAMLRVSGEDNVFNISLLKNEYSRAGLLWEFLVVYFGDMCATIQILDASVGDGAGHRRLRDQVRSSWNFWTFQCMEMRLATVSTKYGS